MYIVQIIADALLFMNNYPKLSRSEVEAHIQQEIDKRNDKISTEADVIYDICKFIRTTYMKIKCVEVIEKADLLRQGEFINYQLVKGLFYEYLLNERQRDED